MSKPAVIKIDDVEYVRKTAAPGDMKIVVLDRGFVYIGRVEIRDDFVHIREAQNIRKWGTTRGLGELVNGPTASTALDPVGVVIAPVRALISLIDVDESKWN